MQSFHICKLWDIAIVLMLAFKVKDKVGGSIVVCMVLGLESLRTAAVDFSSVCVSSESWLLFSVVSDPSHGYVTPLIRQSMISLEREKIIL